MPTLAMSAIVFAFAASATTYLGGRFALWLGERFGWLTALTAGMILGIALIDLFPEALALGRGIHPPSALVLLFAAGFAGNLLLDRLLHLGRTTLPAQPHLGPASLSLHSFLDGMSIGLAFHVSFGAGIVIAVAVLVHDFADGVNTVRLGLAAAGRNGAHAWLIIDSLAPVVGAAFGLAIVLGAATRSSVLALVAGAFLYIGTRELAQLGRKQASARETALAALIGAAAIGGIVHFAG